MALALITDRKDFITYLNEEKAKFKPLGKKIGEFKREIPIIKAETKGKQLAKRKAASVCAKKPAKTEQETKVFEVYKVDA